MQEIFYKDGRPYNPPGNPLIEKWKAQYPPKVLLPNSPVCDKYSCSWCDRCPEGDDWKVPVEDKAVYDKWREDVERYHNENGGIEDLMISEILNDLIAEEISKAAKQYVLVSQGIEIFRTDDKAFAENMMNEQNEDYYRYCEECAENNERVADNEVFMFEEN